MWPHWRAGGVSPGNHRLQGVVHFFMQTGSPWWYKRDTADDCTEQWAKTGTSPGKLKQHTATLIRDQRGLTCHPSNSHFSDEETETPKGEITCPRCWITWRSTTIRMPWSRAPQIAKVKKKKRKRRKKRTAGCIREKRHSVCQMPQESRVIHSAAQRLVMASLSWGKNVNWLHLVIHEIAVTLKRHSSSAPLKAGGTASKAAHLDTHTAPHRDTAGGTVIQEHRNLGSSFISALTNWGSLGSLHPLSAFQIPYLNSECWFRSWFVLPTKWFFFFFRNALRICAHQFYKFPTPHLSSLSNVLLHSISIPWLAQPS